MAHSIRVLKWLHIVEFLTLNICETFNMLSCMQWKTVTKYSNIHPSIREEKTVQKTPKASSFTSYK